CARCAPAARPGPGARPSRRSLAEGAGRAAVVRRRSPGYIARRCHAAAGCRRHRSHAAGRRAAATATALVEAMLALIAPAPVHPAAPAGSVATGIVDATAARLAAAQAGLAALGQAGASAAPAAPAVDPAVMAATTTVPAAELLKLDTAATRETVRLDPAPGAAPVITQTAATV